MGKEILNSIITGEEVRGDMLGFKNEKAFEDSIISHDTGWRYFQNNPRVIKQDELWDNFFNIIERINQSKAQLFPLSEDEKEQIKLEIAMNTGRVYNAHAYLLDGQISFSRDGKTEVLDIFKRDKECMNIYQILRQPHFPKKEKEGRDSRGDIFLLINGLPLVHIELKAKDSDIEKGVDQVERYITEGNYNGLYGFTQICCSMTPNDFRYFARTDGKLNRKYVFKWTDEHNKPIGEWEKIFRVFLNTAMVWDFIWYYVTGDSREETTKVVRPYQYYGCEKIVDRVRKYRKGDLRKAGGYVHCATGGGKTLMTYIVSNILTWKFEDLKVVTVVDRRDLDVQCLDYYKQTAQIESEISKTESVRSLRKALMKDKGYGVIVTTSQKMLKLTEDFTDREEKKAKGLKVVFLVDECHRGAEGSYQQALNKFEDGITFGFTGTPTYAENSTHADTRTVDIYGSELYSYTIGDAIRDKNVLGFDIRYISTYDKTEMRRQVALTKANAKSLGEVLRSEEKKGIYKEWMAKPMQEIEASCPNSQYDTIEHKKKVAEDIAESIEMDTDGYYYSAMFTVKNIADALWYYKEIKKLKPELKVSVVVDQSDEGGNKRKSMKGMQEVVKDYNRNFGKSYDIGKTYAEYKKDVQKRMAHTTSTLPLKEEERLNLVIVVYQMTTGYDSKYLNTLYCDREPTYDSLLQVMSRTNRLEENSKPHGTVVFYRRPYRMAAEVDKAFRLYAPDNHEKIRAISLYENIKHINMLYESIEALYGIENKSYKKETLTKDNAEIFLKRFTELNHKVKVATLQGMNWEKDIYEDIEIDPNEVESESKRVSKVKRKLSLNTYKILMTRFKEMATHKYRVVNEVPPFEIKALLTEADRITIDEKSIDKYLAELNKVTNEKRRKEVLRELNRLLYLYDDDKRREVQKLIDDIEEGMLEWTEDMSISQEISKRMEAEEDRLIAKLGEYGVDEEKLKVLRKTRNTSNEYNRFNEMLGSSREQIQAIKVLVQEECEKDAYQKFKELLKNFIVTGRV